MPDTGTLTMAGIWAGVVTLIGLLIRNIGPWRKQITEVEEKLRGEMHSQINELHQQLRDERAQHAVELATEKAIATEAVKAHEREREDWRQEMARFDKRHTRQQVRHNAERSLDRHRLNNINQCFGALLMLLKTSHDDPEKVKEAIALVEEMREKMILAETEEKAIIRAAEIAADDCVESDHDGN